MTSSIFVDRTVRGPWAPSTHATASTTLDLPLPFGPTTTVIPGSNTSVVTSAKDLKPLRVSDFRNTVERGYRGRDSDTVRAALTLTGRTEVGAALGDHDLFDRCAAAATRLAVPVVDLVTEGVPPGRPVGVDVALVVEARPPGLDRGLQDAPNVRFAARGLGRA